MHRAQAGWASRGPVVLEPNQPERSYRGGAGIARLRGLPTHSDFAPEDFLASTTSLHGCVGQGLTKLPDGTLLSEAIKAAPEWFLSPEHHERFGANPQVLIKLLNPEQRLFSHFHPDDDFARTYLDAPNGKTEAWVVTEAPEGGARAYLGFSEPVDDAEVTEWIRRQDASKVLAAMNEFQLATGSSLLVPAGLPHALDPGLTIVELQQPADLSILLEYRDFPDFTEESALLGLEPSVAARALDKSAWTAAELGALGEQRPADGSPEGIVPLFPPAADRYFRAQEIRTSDAVTLHAEFSVLVVTNGSGHLGWDRGTLPLRRGTILLIPYGVGPCVLEGTLAAVRCMPPSA